MSPELIAHVEALRTCRRCPRMIGPPVAPRPVRSRIYLVGQAPGPREASLGRPFAWTAGRTLFSWFARLGVDEETFRSRVWMAAVCRCFPGKAEGGGGDRVPSPEEVQNCAPWMAAEVSMLDPLLVVPVGRLAIERFLPKAPLAETVGRLHRVEVFGRRRDVIPLPHPSGASTWHRTEPGTTLLAQALVLVAPWLTPRDAGSPPPPAETS